MGEGDGSWDWDLLGCCSVGAWRIPRSWDGSQNLGAQGGPWAPLVVPTSQGGPKDGWQAGKHLGWPQNPIGCFPAFQEGPQGQGQTPGGAWGPQDTSGASEMIPKKRRTPDGAQKSG